ncbi:MAG: CoA pyrophosphatase [Actinomycetota bacterium]|nr:CoA pyrophosphatase [Actinomycetota bacterium]
MRDVWQRLARLPSRLPESALPPVAAVLVPLYEDHGGQVRVVLIKRPDHMPTHAGQLAFPGGMAAPTDADVVATALREAWEEVGIEPGAVEVLGFLDPVPTASASLVVVPVVGRLPSRPDITPDPGEVELVLEPLLEEFLHDSRWRWEAWGELQVWFFEVDEEVLWGATARMMRQLVAFLVPSSPS